MNDLKINTGLHLRSLITAFCAFWCLFFFNPCGAQETRDYTAGQITDLRTRLRPVADSLFRIVEQATAQRAALEQEWATAQMDSSLRKGQRDTLKNTLKTVQKIEKEQLGQLKKINEVVEWAAQISSMDSVGQIKNLPKLEKKAAKYIAIAPKTPPASPVSQTVETPPAKDTAQVTLKIEQSTPPKSVGPVFASYDPKQDVMLYPPKPPCVLVQNSREEFSGQIIRQTASAEIFQFTNPALRKDLQGKIHIICRAAILVKGAEHTLLLNFNIQDPNARKAFGKLDKSAAATLQFIDGSTFIINNLRGDDGTFYPIEQTASFQGQFPIDGEVLKKMRRTELDKIRIAWAAGYEDYEVQQVDALIRLLGCL
jgi:hypothetical protein